MDVLARSVDAVELWLTGLPFVLQVSLVLVVLSMIAMLVVQVLTALINRVGDALHGPLGSAGEEEDAGHVPAEEERSGV
ncbi:putative protein OS=Tsukamurella paurometabola (strain ATCC 8368 / DSM / CCUG 35730 /CIP 100753 / JCM 10117 / KCTC 9821 / NBRC 16120 / NCIMB 702349/ NCTC 13040) OX=521096 GN=Tpau_2782 PE=4 SV=1 [Tsukamurella paurometabola]|uniref:Uncharacterized protein n=1 Tax=Tsukamurella paurometabola (strain ATCC 8368 / DSM 20162 / CCUG 35730 / CIP 100753 / JCM 10117 / KCTC 9821 / NBRC 16120 / NCIMB 702349 / NCTC 13040) TaxID=521096 RepID=D5UT95_TSUPD|nr:hypothetical protein [Tsukamurella paurometabola]ADG79380.1 hypothetical protein Tpau_2782 [Tsukamurella paurometabola DSM 20162]SUP35471.1 Uncharacterised protein [Tsukamurella paurometabola]